MAASAARYKRILCGVDFSAGSREAFRAAVETARLHSSALHLLHVVEARPALPADALLVTIERGKEAVARLVDSEQPPLGDSLTTEVISGRAAEEIGRIARQWHADLIVVGAKGITSLEETFVGGTAEGVAREAPCSVLIVR